MGLAWWMVHDDSHSTLRASADNSSRRAASVAMAVLPTGVRLRMLTRRLAAKISNSRDIPPKIGINHQSEASNSEFIPMHSLDAIDRKILGALQSDGRITMQQLADKVGLSVSPCHRRVKLLEERGVITRYIATVDQKSLGLHVS